METRSFDDSVPTVESSMERILSDSRTSADVTNRLRDPVMEGSFATLCVINLYQNTACKATWHAAPNISALSDNEDEFDMSENEYIPGFQNA